VNLCVCYQNRGSAEMDPATALSITGVTYTQRLMNEMCVWCHCGVIVVLLWCYCGVTVVLLWNYCCVLVVSLPRSTVIENGRGEGKRYIRCGSAYLWCLLCSLALSLSFTPIRQTHTHS
jgi:hypothetical protein